MGLLGPTAARACACGCVSHAPLVSHAPCPPPVSFPAPSQCSPPPSKRQTLPQPLSSWSVSSASTRPQSPTFTSARAVFPPGPASAHLPPFPSAGPGLPQRLGSPAAASTPAAAAGAAGGPAGRPESSAGCGRPLGPGSAAAPGRLRRPCPGAPSQWPWKDSERHRGCRGHELQLLRGGGRPGRGSPLLLRRAAGSVLRLRAALGRTAAHPMRQQPVGGQQWGGESRWGGA